MNILVYMGHPAHFYLYKNAIINWRNDRFVRDVGIL